jgi:tyrosine aminotransferase
VDGLTDSPSFYVVHRVGWIQVHDRHGLLAEVRQGLNRLTTLILGPNTLVQGVLPQMLHNTPEEFYQHSLSQLEANANLLVERLARVPGINVIKPSGAMYVMVRRGGIGHNGYVGF